MAKKISFFVFICEIRSKTLIRRSNPKIYQRYSIVQYTHRKLALTLEWTIEHPKIEEMIHNCLASILWSIFIRLMFQEFLVNLAELQTFRSVIGFLQKNMDFWVPDLNFAFVSLGKYKKAIYLPDPIWQISRYFNATTVSVRIGFYRLYRLFRRTDRIANNHATRIYGI